MGSAASAQRGTSQARGAQVVPIPASGSVRNNAWVRAEIPLQSPRRVEATPANPQDPPEQPGTPGADDQLLLPGQLGGDGPGGAGPAGPQAAPPILPIPPILGAITPEQPQPPAVRAPAAAESARDAPSSEGCEIEAAAEEGRGEEHPAAPAAAAPVVLATAADYLAQLDTRKLVLIVWDIESVMPPSDLFSRHVIRYIKRHFIGPGRTEYRTVTALRNETLVAILRVDRLFVDMVVPNLTLLMAGSCGKRNADAMLRKEIDNFVYEYARVARLRPGELTVVLISGDGYYKESLQNAIEKGFNVEVMAARGGAAWMSPEQGFATQPLRWIPFLQQQMQQPL